MKYKVGDKVRVREDLQCNKFYYMDDEKGVVMAITGMLRFRGKQVTIDYVATNGSFYKIKEYGCLWTDEMFENGVFDIYSDYDWCVIIKPDGDKTIGKILRNGKVVKEVSVIKHHSDKYSMKTACEVVMDRLFEKKIKEDNKKTSPYYNGKFRVTYRPFGFAYTVGKTYEVKDGQWVLDTDIIYPYPPCKSFDEVRKCCIADIVEVTD